MSEGTGVTGDSGHLLDRVRLTGITATGYHGVFAHERREGQVFVADVVVHLDTRRAAATDDLRHTLDYGALAEQVAAVLTGEPADLIETVAERIAATVLAHPQVQAVDVAVHKPQAPITVPFGEVVVEVRRDRHRLPAAEPLRTDVEHRPWHPAGTTAAAPAAPALPVPTSPPTAPLPTVPPAEVPVPVAAALPVPADLPVPAAPAGPPLDAPAPLEVPGTPEDPDPVVDAVVVPALAPVDAPAGPPAEEVVEAELVQDQLDLAPDGPVEVVLAIGSNLGAAQETLRDAVAEIGALPGVELVAVSALARTAPVGGPEQPDFLNAVLIARTTLSPRDLLRATASVEQAHGRERTVHWGPRTLDVDIIVYGAVSAVTDDLELPHPRAHERAFVLQPWAQVQPDAVLHGLGGGPVAALAATAPDNDGVRWLALDWLTAATLPETPHRDLDAPAPERSSVTAGWSGEAPGPATTAWLPDPDEQPGPPPAAIVVEDPAPAPTAPRWPDLGLGTGDGPGRQDG
jgi:dihydroneopterin aldolase/2-amino-4-hydroxy-6-hydroxymethyldihydropteridine diphosphokinase